jgi:hypothetical protein
VGQRRGQAGSHHQRATVAMITSQGADLVQSAAVEESERRARCAADEEDHKVPDRSDHGPGGDHLPPDQPFPGLETLVGLSATVVLRRAISADISVLDITVPPGLGARGFAVDRKPATRTSVKVKRPSTEAASGCGAEGDGREADCVRG